MLDNESNIVKSVDKLILDEFKKKLEIEKDKINMLSDSDMNEILKRINEKKEIIFLLFQGDFSTNEEIIEERIEHVKTDLSFYDKIANNIILKRLDVALRKIECQYPSNNRLVSVCLDRKLFIEKILTKNISLEFLQEHIQKEKTER